MTKKADSLRLKAATQLAQAYREYCSERRRAWSGRPDDEGRSDLWLGRQEAMGSFIEWMQRDGED